MKEKDKICIITHKILKSIKCRRLKILRNEEFFGGYLSEIPQEIVGLLYLSDYFCRIRVPWKFFNMMKPFLHSKMDFEQQKIMIRSAKKTTKKTFHRTISQPFF